MLTLLLLELEKHNPRLANDLRLSDLQRKETRQYLIRNVALRGNAGFT